MCRGRHKTGDSVETTSTARLRLVELLPDADVALRVQALVKLLVDKGLIKEEEYEEAVRALSKTSGE